MCLKVSIISSYMEFPREGNLEQVFHIFTHLNKYHNTEMVFDPSNPVIDEASFERKEWTSSEFGHLDGTE